MKDKTWQEVCDAMEQRTQSYVDAEQNGIRFARFARKLIDGFAMIDDENTGDRELIDKLWKEAR